MDLTLDVKRVVNNIMTFWEAANAEQRKTLTISSETLAMYAADMKGDELAKAKEAKEATEDDRNRKTHAGNR